MQCVAVTVYAPGDSNTTLSCAAAALLGGVAASGMFMAAGPAVDGLDVDSSGLGVPDVTCCCAEAVATCCCADVLDGAFC